MKVPGVVNARTEAEQGGMESSARIYCEKEGCEKEGRERIQRRTSRAGELKVTATLQERRLLEVEWVRSLVQGDYEGFENCGEARGVEGSIEEEKICLCLRRW